MRRDLCSRACLLSVTTLSLLTPTTISAAIFRRNTHPTSTNSKISLRKRLHVNTLITEPGTAELDWTNIYSLTTSNFDMPSASSTRHRALTLFGAAPNTAPPSTR